MLLDAVVLSFLLALCAGGRVSRLKDLELRAVWLFVLAAVVRVALDVLGAKGSPLTPRLGPLLSIGAYLCLLVAFAFNWHLRSLRVVAIGVLLNSLVIAANGGSMPVDRVLAQRSVSPRLVRLMSSPYYIVHKPVTARTRLPFLADVLPLPMFPPRPAWYSPGSVGDVLITFGACAFLLTGLGAFGLGRRRASPAEVKAP